MAIETITIRNRYQNDSNKGPYLKVILDDDSSVFVWEEHLFPRVPDHGQLTGEVDRSTRYPRLTSVVDTSTGEVSRKPTTAADREYHITRQVALKCAIEALEKINAGAVVNNPGVASAYTSVVLDLAQRFTDWLNGYPDELPF